jgi:site-specific recombinase XerD
MALKKRGNVWWIDITVNGKRFRESTKTEDKGLAKKFHDARMKELYTQEHGLKPKGKPSGLTLKQAYDRAYKEFWSINSKSPETYDHNWKIIEEIIGGNTLLDDIDRARLTTLVSTMIDKGYTLATINRKLSLISKILTLAVEWGEVSNIPKIPRMKERNNRIRWVSDKEESLITGVLRDKGDHYRCLMASFVEFLRDTGMRLSEGLGVEEKDIDLTKAVIYVWENKADHPRMVPMTDRVKGILEDRLRFGNKPFGVLTKDKCEHYWNWAKERIGLSGDKYFVIHALRHATASRLVNAGVDLMIVKEYLGHKSIQTTLKYAHLDPERLRKATETLNGGKSSEPQE